jgi:hypothetical protein
MSQYWKAFAASFCLIASTVATAEVPNPDVLPPVILQMPQLFTPIETAGTGLAPAVSVRLVVSPSGAVSSLEVASIVPSTDYDVLFERAVLDSASDWRFAPALENGTPVERALEWQLEFRPATSNAMSNGRLAPSPTSLVRDEEREFARLMKVFTLPIAMQKAHLNHLVSLAENPLEQRTRRALTDRSIVVVTDHPDKNAIGAAMSTVQAASRIAVEVFGQDIPLDEPTMPLFVYVYRSRAQYQRFIASVDGIVESSGVFCPPGLIAIHAEHFSSESIVANLIHETVHAAMYRRIVKPGQVMPRWISEGLADYLANSKIKKGVLYPGEYAATEVYRNQARLWRGRSIARMGLEQVRRTIRRGDALSVESIVSADRETFYGANIGLYYDQAWLLVHYLRHGHPQWRSGQFKDLLLYMAEGYRSDDALMAVYGVEPADLETGYREHVKQF